MKRTFIILLATLLILAGCAPEAAPSEAAQTPEPPDVTFLPDEPSFEGGDPLTLLLRPNSSASESKQLAYAQKILDDAGFSIRLETYAGSWQDADYNEKYLEALEARQGENLVFLLNGTTSSVTEFIEGMPVKSLADEAHNLAPEFANEFVVNDVVATGFNPAAAVPVHPAVLIKNDVYAAYGKEITTAREYADLLRYLKESDPKLTPAAASPSYYMRIYQHNPVLSLFLPEYGQYSLAAALGGLPVDVFYDEQSDNWLLPHESEHFTAALREFSAWGSEGLIDYWNYYNKRDFAKYPTLLVNTRDFVNSSFKTDVPEYRNLEMENYRLCVLYPDTLPIAPISKAESAPAFAFAMQNADVAEFFRFMEWLGDEDNYRLFLNGVEGIDYNIVDNRFVYEKTDVAYNEWRQRNYFLRPEFETLAIDNVPSNYEEVLNMTAPNTLPINTEELRASLMITSRNDAKFNAAAEKVVKDSISLNDQTFMPGGTLHADAWIEKYIREQSESEQSAYFIKTLRELLVGAQ